jgi:hypothetical protein
VLTLSVKKIPLIPQRTRSPASNDRSNRTVCVRFTPEFPLPELTRWETVRTGNHLINRDIGFLPDPV